MKEVCLLSKLRAPFLGVLHYPLLGYSFIGVAEVPYCSYYLCVQVRVKLVGT